MQSQLRTANQIRIRNSRGSTDPHRQGRGNCADSGVGTVGTVGTGVKRCYLLFPLGSVVRAGIAATVLSVHKELDVPHWGQMYR